MGDSMNSYSWYHGKVSRNECEQLLNQRDRPGLFLVRDSNTIQGDYVLSVREVGKVSHYIINFNRASRVYKIGEQTFDDLPSIVEFYKKHFLDSTTLVEPATRPGFQPPGGGGGQPPRQAPVNSLKVKAKYNFVGSDLEDLSFKKGDILTILKKEEDDWWLARHSNGQEGLIPRPYVEEMPAVAIGPRITSYPPVQDRAMPDRYSSGPDYSQPMGTPNTRQPQEPSIPALPPGPVMARAIQSRDPSFYDPTELKFQKDDRIRVLRRNENGIWEGENLENGNKGHFPFTFVEILKDQS
ncbi:crk-like protein [Rhopilema esculentum]|uniref:crk-like protein n=1 Tax=Rhopilema esculentum TaxID=499914 RepID=UPI0031E489DB|eukprot:gene12891-3643_t